MKIKLIRISTIPYSIFIFPYILSCIFVKIISQINIDKVFKMYTVLEYAGQDWLHFVCLILLYIRYYLSVMNNIYLSEGISLAIDEQQG